MLHHTINLIVGVGWLGFIVYWVVEATKTKGSKGGARSYGYFALYRFLILILILAIIFSHKGNSKYVYSNFRIHSAIVEIIGLALFLAGLSFAIWARQHLSSNWGMPMTQKLKPTLIKTGPYKYVRHPIYTGMLLAMLATALTTSLYWLIIFVAISAYFIYSAKQEEKYMLELFPKDYPTYQKNTKFIVPLIY